MTVILIIVGYILNVLINRYLWILMKKLDKDIEFDELVVFCYWTSLVGTIIFIAMYMFVFLDERVVEKIKISGEFKKWLYCEK